MSLLLRSKTIHVALSYCSISLKGQVSELLKLPREVRLLIYEHATQLTRTDHLNLLHTCRKIYEEGLISFLTRPLKFHNQGDLINGLSRLPSKHAQQITTLGLALADLEEDKVRTYLDHFMSTSSTNVLDNPYYVELDRLVHALSPLHGLQSLTINRQFDPSVRNAPDILVAGFISWIAKSLPRLQHLTIDVDNFSLHHLRGARQLKGLRISGFSNSTPAQTRTALASLPNLQELHLAAAGYPMREPFFRCGGEQLQSVTSEVVSALRPLRTLTFIEPVESQTSDEGPVFLTEEIFDAVARRHGDTLEKLTIGSLHSIPASAMAALSRLFGSVSRLRSLTLGLSLPADRDSVILKDINLPNLQSLEVLVNTSAEAVKAFDTLSTISSRIPELRSVTFLTLASTAMSEGARELSANVTLDVTVHWRLWRPFGDDMDDASG